MIIFTAPDKDKFVAAGQGMKVQTAITVRNERGILIIQKCIQVLIWTYKYPFLSKFMKSIS
jgi:hypothetical protein